MSDIPGKGAAEVEKEGAEFIARQQEEFRKSQEDAAKAGHPVQPLNDDQIRAIGGYLLMDEQWVVSSGFGKDGVEANTPENRRVIIESEASARTALPFKRDGEIAGYFPAVRNVVGDVYELGDGLAAGLLLPSLYVEGQN